MREVVCWLCVGFKSQYKLNQNSDCFIDETIHIIQSSDYFVVVVAIMIHIAARDLVHPGAELAFLQFLCRNEILASIWFLAKSFSNWMSSSLPVTSPEPIFEIGPMWCDPLFFFFQYLTTSINSIIFSLYASPIITTSP